MNRSACIISLSCCLLFAACDLHQEPDRMNYIITEKDLVPEGLAFDPATQTIYVSSTWKRKIIAMDKNGKLSDFITESQFDIKSVVGMEVDRKRNCLWAISSEANEVLPLKDPGEFQWRSSVYQFSLPDGKLIKRYNLDKDSVFLNDLCVAPDGTVYITETRQKAIYRLRPGADTLELFLEPKPFNFINGICFTDKPGILFACSREGIISIDIATKKYSLLPSANINSGGIDGLAFHKNYFIAHQSSKVVRLYLSENRDNIILVDTLDSGKEFDSSTTGEVWGDDYYFIVNSQISSGVNYEKATIKLMDSLENIIIRKIKL